MDKVFNKKWKRYNLMIESPKVKPHVLKTQIFTYGNYLDFLSDFGAVFLKPNDGRRGRGIIKVVSTGMNYYDIYHEEKKVRNLGIVRTYNYVKELIGDEFYLVQQPVELPLIGNRIMEFRVITQRKSYVLPWEVTGMAVKVGGEGYIVSNTARSGGDILTVEEGVAASNLTIPDLEKLKENIEEVAVNAAVKLTQEYEYKRIYGFDIAVDKNGKIWIIEANMNPMLSHFKMLKDKSLYKKIKRIKKKKVAL
ncbi:YheC/YheD family protein [Evansella clarkii]|jgi:hypothetical protein|uniref:YheC/YheD family protein n=1 Tax=Evansella clarkii TaxID=79879 RepID=UPI000995F74E|nr:YheC/YheD family protein [Evansella clarkii]